MQRARVALIVVVAMAAGCARAAAQEPSPDVSVAPMVRIDPDGESRGAVIVIHGGAWNGHGAGAVERVRPAALRMVRHGYTAYLVDYRPGADGFADVLADYRTVREATPVEQPVCAWGESSGGHFALMLDARTQLDCVMASGAPTDLRRIARRITATRLYLQRLVDAVFAGRPGGLREWSPVFFTRDMTANTALLYARHDRLIDPAQGRSLAARLRLPSSRLVLAGRGAVPFVHGRIDETSWSRFVSQERAVLRAASRGRPGPAGTRNTATPPPGS